MRKILAMAIAVALSGSNVFAADAVRHVTVSSDDVIALHTSVREYTSIVLDTGEKALIYFCGDPKYWDVKIIQGAEHFVMVKPSVSGRATDIHILTDHNHDYAIKADEAGPGEPVDVKLFIEPSDAQSLQAPATLMSSAEGDRLKAEIQAQKAEIESLNQQNKAELAAHDQAFRATLPKKLHFDYSFDKNKAPFFVQSVWDDGKFTYIKVDPKAETASFYSLKDGKPNLAQFSYADGLYTIREVVAKGFLQVGRKKSEISARTES